MVYIRIGLIMKPFATIIVTVVELLLQAIPNNIWYSWPFTPYIILQDYAKIESLNKEMGNIGKYNEKLIR